MLPLSKVLCVFLTEDKYDRGEGHVLTNINLLPVPAQSHASVLLYLRTQADTGLDH